MTLAGTVQVWAAPVEVKVHVTVVPEVVQSPDAASAGLAATSGTAAAANSAAPTIRCGRRRTLAADMTFPLGSCRPGAPPGDLRAPTVARQRRSIVQPAVPPDRGLTIAQCEVLLGAQRQAFGPDHPETIPTVEELER
ncbi:MAG: hypothetical protein U0P45_07065 [Acidimicrobiales bacterium]